MSVKEILQSLVDDDLVDTDRIGTSNYFWAFPSKASNSVSQSTSVCTCVIIMICWLQRKRKLSELEERTMESKRKKASLQQQVEAASVGREHSVRRCQCSVAMVTGTPPPT